jgi:hypothetical protein
MIEFFVGFLLCGLISSLIVNYLQFKTNEKLEDETDKLKRGVIKISRSYSPGEKNVE